MDDEIRAEFSLMGSSLVDAAHIEQQLGEATDTEQVAFADVLLLNKQTSSTTNHSTAGIRTRDEQNGEGCPQRTG